MNGLESKKRALVVANRLPYPVDDGWKRRTWHLLRGLAREYRVTLATLHGGPPSAVPALVDALGGDLDVIAVAPARTATAKAAVLGLLTRRPYHVWKSRSARLERAIAERDESWDVALATLAHLYPYVRPLACPRIVDTHNIDSLVLRRYAQTMRGPRRWYARQTAARLALHEREVFEAADLVLVCSEEERRRITDEVPAASVTVVPNGVDVDGAFRPLDDADVRASKRVLFFGRLDYFPNTDAVEHFARSILPAVRAAEPDATFEVVGYGATERLRGLLEQRPGVRFIGPVADLRSVVGSAAAVVVPLRSGGGTRLKILEALSLARPVVSTTVGAEGLALEPGRDLLIEDEPERIAAAVVRLLRNPGDARELGRAGRAAVERGYAWTRIETKLIELLGRVARSPDARRDAAVS